jgi:hypothetical protein
MRWKPSDVKQEATNELVSGERHALVTSAAVGAIVLAAERDAGIVAGDESTVGDGNAVGVARARLCPGWKAAALPSKRLINRRKRKPARKRVSSVKV